MASNSFGNLFRMTTWGESHGKAIGVVIDGCPAGLPLCEEDINIALALRAPGKTTYTSPRQEKDHAEIYSGVFEGKTTGTPISIIVINKDADPSQYDNIKNVLRPGHANFTYLEKYGIFDYRGGGRASARETVGRVAAGAVAQKILAHFDIFTCAYLSSVGAETTHIEHDSAKTLKEKTLSSPIFCPDPIVEKNIQEHIHKIKEEGDSLGGIVTFMATGLPVGLGDPIYEKLEANLAKAMMSLPATKGFEIGEGFDASSQRGSEHNDSFINNNDQIKTVTNKAGGILGGISTGMPLLGKVAFKPTSSIKKTQETVDLKGDRAEFKLPENARHDPCVAIRAVPIVEAMLSLVLVDALLMNRISKL